MDCITTICGQISYFDQGKGNGYLYYGQNRFIGVHTHDELMVTAKEEGTIVQSMYEINR